MRPLLGICGIESALMARSTPDPRTVLEAALTKSGLSLRRFATDVLSRDERTVRRWRSGDSPIPDTAADWLAEYAEGRVTVSGPLVEP